MPRLLPRPSATRDFVTNALKRDAQEEQRRDRQVEELKVHMLRHASKASGQEAQPRRASDPALREEAERPGLRRSSSFSSGTSSPATSPVPLREMPRTLESSTGIAPRRGPGTHPALKTPRAKKTTTRNESSAQLEGLPIRHSGVSDIMNEISVVSAEAQGSGKIFKTPRLDAQKEQRRERQAEELMMHVSRHTRKRPLSCDEKKRREVVMLNRERMLLSSDLEPRDEDRETKQSKTA